MTHRIALITGINGMDGSHLAELLLLKKYIVHGIIRKSSHINTRYLDDIYEEPGNKKTFFLHYGDLTDSQSLTRLIQSIGPDEVYNLGAMSHVKVSFELPEFTGDVDALGVLRVLDAIRMYMQSSGKGVRMYQASTSEMFGGVSNKQNEWTAFYPKSPYGVAKLYGYWITRNYRESYKMFACNGILFNHTSDRRGETFLEKKVVTAAVAIKHKKQKCLYLGNLDSKRDIGSAKDYVLGMWMMLQQEFPGDYVLATGVTYTIREIVEMCFDAVDIPITWFGKGLDEVGINKYTGNVIISIDPDLFRPSEVDVLCGDASHARDVLGWVPSMTLFEIIKEMVGLEIQRVLK